MSASSATKVEKKRSIPSEIASLIPPDVQYFFKHPPLLNEEDPIDYWILVGQFIKHVSPKTIIEWIWLKDVIDLTWEIWRLRRLRAAAVRDAPAWADFAPIPRGMSREEIFDSEDVGAARLVFKINHYQAFDKLLASAELRRDRILAQVEFHVAQRLREAADTVEGNFDKPRLAAA